MGSVRDRLTLKDDHKEKRRKRSSEEEYETERKVEKSSKPPESPKKSESETVETDTVESEPAETEPAKGENIRKISRNSDVPSENDDEPENTEKFEPYQLSRDEIDDLEEFTLPQNPQDLKKLASGGRDRDDRDALMIVLDWKCVKSQIRNYRKEEFKQLRSVVKNLVEAGADFGHKDKFGKSAVHLLADWRFLKEKPEVDILLFRYRVYKVPL